MGYTFHVRLHPLGVVVSERPGMRGELLIPGEDCCGVSFEELALAASNGGLVEVSDARSRDCPLHRHP